MYDSQCSQQSMCSRRRVWFHQSRKQMEAEPKETEAKTEPDAGSMTIDANPMLGEM